MKVLPVSTCLSMATVGFILIRTLKSLDKVVETKGFALFGFFYPLLRSLGFAILATISYLICKGTEYGVSLSLMVPISYGLYTSLPYISWFTGELTALLVLMGVLLYELEKRANFLVCIIRKTTSLAMCNQSWLAFTGRLTLISVNLPSQFLHSNTLGISRGKGLGSQGYLIYY